MTKLDAKLSPDKIAQRSVGEPAAPAGYFLATARDKRTFLYLLSLLLDILSLVAGYLVALQWRDEQWLAAGGQSIIYIALPIFIMFEIAREAQDSETLANRLAAIQRSLGALGATAIVVIGMGFLFKSEDISRLGLAVTFGAAAVFVIASKFLIDALAKKMIGAAVVSTILILDGLPARPEPHADVVDVTGDDLWPDLDRPDKIDHLSRLISPYDRVIVACRFEHRPAWATFLRGHDVGGEILFDRDHLHGAVAIGQYDDRDTIILSRGPLDLMNRIQKRALDLVVASLASILLLPLLLLVALAIRLESPGPVLFRQLRVGQGNRQFRIFKFRSMHVERSDADGHRSASRADDRITRVGRIIRRTSIDELPQLLNVLRGEMSMVGPRPHALGSTAGDELFWHASQQYWLRHALKPGITGLAQIRGFRGATEQVEDLARRVRCDLEYLSNWSLWGDIAIMLKTIRVVIHKNAY
ncbi:exopolysaccharide biosynthesis polyprenyl glycosylphosphotransferase [Sphingopyxis solisilvae]|uniref:exopolysaccharide biosynthesis polyprenyl glycosylphosphotransferase n=1 Tax=Sphingopyxis solisilvae TaxID=1886788 RepID=UPI0018929A8A|nr:exopolysaccharide biosynthesis polyprenyl glycosylphosphotransferase [Sphingopyxis solisilvae]